MWIFATKCFSTFCRKLPDSNESVLLRKSRHYGMLVAILDRHGRERIAWKGKVGWNRCNPRKFKISNKPTTFNFCEINNDGRYKITFFFDVENSFYVHVARSFSVLIFRVRCNLYQLQCNIQYLGERYDPWTCWKSFYLSFKNLLICVNHFRVSSFLLFSINEKYGN